MPTTRLEAFSDGVLATILRLFPDQRIERLLAAGAASKAIDPAVH